jgi:hypothetical protein
MKKKKKTKPRTEQIIKTRKVNIQFRVRDPIRQPPIAEWHVKHVHRRVMVLTCSSDMNHLFPEEKRQLPVKNSRSFDKKATCTVRNLPMSSRTNAITRSYFLSSIVLHGGVQRHLIREASMQQRLLFHSHVVNWNWITLHETTQVEWCTGASMNRSKVSIPKTLWNNLRPNVAIN